jgi:hypothetical protein
LPDAERWRGAQATVSQPFLEAMPDGYAHVIEYPREVGVRLSISGSSLEDSQQRKGTPAAYPA